jgi:hypothetical protein
MNEIGRTLAAVLVASIIIYGLLPSETSFDITSTMYWDVWAATYLGLTWFLILRSSQEQTRRWARAHRTVPRRSRLSLLRSGLLRALQVLFLVGRTSSLLFIIVISLAGLLSALSLLPDMRDVETVEGKLAFVLNTLGVVAAWAVIHTSYGLYYASRYYRSEESPGGLEFPGEENPRQLDFAYFAFTIGTSFGKSFAVSDVEVTDSTMRQSVLGHQILSFFYSTIILGLVINLIISL